MGLKDEFEAALSQVRSLPEQGNETLLELYSLYKQAAEGDVSGDRPGFLDFKGQAKYDAWKEREGMSGDEAMQAYVDLVARLGG